MVPFGIMHDLTAFYILTDVPPKEADLEDGYLNGQPSPGFQTLTGLRLDAKRRKMIGMSDIPVQPVSAT
jgi:hypothetical protein